MTRLVVFSLLLAAPGCRRAGEARPVDERLLLTLEEARARQHSADVHLADGDVASALGDIGEVLKIAFPPGAPEGEEARLDAWGRLAKLHLGATEESEARALQDLENGRKEATRDSFYRAHLETVAGEILEARARRLTDGEMAKSARREALAAYARSIAINQRVQAALLSETR